MSAFLEPIGDTVACIAKAKINLSPNGRAMVGKIHALTLNDDQPITLKCRPVLLFKVRMQYEIVRTEHEPERGPWRVSTRGYMYELQTASGELVWSYHWHPTSRVGGPHAHLGRTQLAPDAVLSYKAHHPTGRISLESVIRACIAEYGVTPVKDDWEEILARREADFEAHRTWR
ncbi:hypothetical protein [Trebonia sp.]|uniref:hypothetical protein n=1 Tax=Trebonia sp. TaxID=2767075 RepID=UPI00261D2BF5|nr:hypothetical protein [Trebonia sp.]